MIGLFILAILLSWGVSYIIIIDRWTYTDDYGNDITHPQAVFLWILVNIFIAIAIINRCGG